MDSANSGSMQSSSDGEEEYESSHCAASSAAVSYNLPPQNPYNHAAALYAAPPPQYFDPLAGFFEPPPRPNQNSLPSSLDQNPEINTSLIRQPIQPPPPPSDQSNGGGAKPGRNPKKRLRASRRAPTTVLTTDTSNFRAMVQEFTGIPAPPFGSAAASSSFLFPRTRLELFGGGAANRGGAGGNPLLPEIQASQLPSYLMRPFAATATTNSTSTAAAGDINYQLQLPDLGLLSSMRMDPVGGFGHTPAASSAGVSRGEKRPLSWAEELRLAADEGGGRSGNGGNCNQQVIPADHSSKGNGNATSLRCEGMLESWICSSTD